MPLQTPKSRKQAGDTIVEVLIAIGIVSMVLVGAFLVASHSTRAVQDSAEHATGQQFLQSQVEMLRLYLATHQAPTDLKFCFKSNDDGTFAYQTIVSPTSNPCSSTVGGAAYAPVISPIGSNTYNNTVSWPSITGGTAQQAFLYRAYSGV